MACLGTVLLGRGRRQQSFVTRSATRLSARVPVPTIWSSVGRSNDMMHYSEASSTHVTGEPIIEFGDKKKHSLCTRRITSSSSTGS